MNLGYSLCPLWLRSGFQLGVAPQVPAGNRAVRLPGTGDLQNLLRLGHLALTVSFFDGGVDSVISCGHDVAAPQSENQEHLRRPHANTFDTREVCDDFFI